ncbi:hypothetical protein M9H77_32468 [Catharanthus roseus]|uniref:Uncharacterized protein n=1 Tax=Catharanthus roseus TaxID=4058 RepID=A0ACC0A3X4_CATRO|nr:hypothetical protein M9H77_32468 [Catharanthus roseus]
MTTLPESFQASPPQTSFFRCSLPIILGTNFPKELTLCHATVVIGIDDPRQMTSAGGDQQAAAGFQSQVPGFQVLADPVLQTLDFTMEKYFGKWKKGPIPIDSLNCNAYPVSDG